MHSTAVPAIPAEAFVPLVDALWPEIVRRLERLDLVPRPPREVRNDTPTKHTGAVVSISTAAALTGRTENQLNDLITGGRMPVVDLFAGRRSRRLRGIPRPWCDMIDTLKRGGLLPPVTRESINLSHLPATMGAALVANELGIARSTVHLLVKRGALKGSGDGHRSCRISRADLEHYLFERMHEAAFYWNTERGG